MMRCVASDRPCSVVFVSCNITCRLALKRAVGCLKIASVTLALFVTWPELIQEELFVIENEIVLQVAPPIHDLTDSMIYKAVVFPHCHMNKIAKAKLNHIFCVATEQIPLSHTVQLSFLRVPGLVPFSDSLSGHPWTRQAQPWIHRDRP